MDLGAYRQPGVMPTIVLDLEGVVPLYRQIADGVRGLIAGGRLGEGDTLPSVRKLGGMLGVNLNTVAKAYRVLAEEGVVELRHGAAARVLAPPPPEDARPLDEEAARQLVDAVGKLKVRGASEDAVREVFEGAMGRFYEEGAGR